RDVAASVQDLRDAIGWNLQLACRRGGAHVQFLQFLGQMFSGMDGEQWHVRSLAGEKLLQDGADLRYMRNADLPNDLHVDVGIIVSNNVTHAAHFSEGSSGMA